MARGPRVLIVDDDPAIRTLLRRAMKAEGYLAEEVEPGPDLLQSIAERSFDLLILDIDAPAAGGLETIRKVRTLSAVPILALSLRGNEEAVVAALDSGADDYMHKPFGTKEIVARANNALRRRVQERGAAPQILIDDLKIDLLHRRVHLGGQEVHLARKPFRVLGVLAENAGRVVTHQDMLVAVWGAHAAVKLECLRLAIRELRRKLEADPAHPRYILTEHGVGYRLEAQGLTSRTRTGETAENRP
jgi:two-component system, OmpR family, KDP operon response regulator KdpE